MDSNITNYEIFHNFDGILDDNWTENNRDIESVNKFSLENYYLDFNNENQDVSFNVTNVTFTNVVDVATYNGNLIDSKFLNNSDGDTVNTITNIANTNKVINNKNSKVKKSKKIWEFILDLLLNPDTCPKLIKWDDREEGTFKFVRNEEIAKMWGERKKNNTMNYEKFSRTMRFWYKHKILLPVPGRKLVYKFGPYASGWKIDDS